MVSKPEDVIKQLRKSGGQKVKVGVADIDGILRGKYLHIDKFLAAAESGSNFCSIIFGWDAHDSFYNHPSFASSQTGFPDAKVNFDLATFRTIPWDHSLPFFLGDFVDSKDHPLDICPRQLLKQILAQAEIAGLYPIVGLEFEWLNFCETPESLAAKNYQHLQPLFPGKFGYSLLRSSLAHEYVNALSDYLREFEIPLEGLHTESGPGMFEAAIAAADALEAADRGLLFKMGVKEIAYRFGIIASFMARCHTQIPGCCGHIHQSLRREDGLNLFFDAGDPLRMSAMFKSYLAGQMFCLPEILPMFAPTVNSYKRLHSDVWAPTQVSWGCDNRLACMRVIPGNEKSIRLELRVGGADINPYLAIAAALAAGLYGIENRLELPAAMTEAPSFLGESGRLASNLLEATDKFYRSQIARELFGEKFVEHFAMTRYWEWHESQKVVTDWEIKRYFEVI